MGIPAYAIDENILGKFAEILSESEFGVSVVEHQSPLAVQYYCRANSGVEILIRFGTCTDALPGKVVVLMQPAKGWPWKVRTQEKMIGQIIELLKTHGARDVRELVLFNRNDR